MISERKRLTLTAVAVVLVGIVTGLLLVGALLPASAADLQYNERTTTVTTVISLVHTHDDRRHTHTTITTTTTTETTTHYTFHQPIPVAASATATTAMVPVPGADEVIMYARSFMPSVITVPVGTTVTFINTDAVEHSVTSADGLFNRYLLEGEGFSYTFAERGNFRFSCQPHPDMLGRVIVE